MVHMRSHTLLCTQGSRALWISPWRLSLNLVAWWSQAAGPPFRLGRVLSGRQARPGFTSASGGGVTHTSDCSRSFSLEEGLSAVSNCHGQSQSLSQDQQHTQRDGLRCRTVKVLLSCQLLLTPAGRKSRFGCVVVVFVHPAYRKRLDSLRQVQFIVHLVFSHVPQMYHPCTVPAHGPRRPDILTGSQ